MSRSAGDDIVEVAIRATETADIRPGVYSATWGAIRPVITTATCAATFDAIYDVIMDAMSIVTSQQTRNHEDDHW